MSCAGYWVSIYVSRRQGCSCAAKRLLDKRPDKVAHRERITKRTKAARGLCSFLAMAINASMVWRVRAGGSNNNGAGFDAAVASAGTDYSDQDAAQLALTDIVAIGTTTLTSVTGGFTAAMIGNVIKLRSFTASGQTGYRVITARTDTNTITVDSNVTAGTGGSGNVGGASATLINYADAGSTAGTPAVTSPLAPGHKIYLRGAGSDTPSADDYTIAGYIIIAAGNVTAGQIQIIGYNGRPQISANGMLFFSLSNFCIENLKVKLTGASNGSIGIFNGSASCHNVWVDQNGQDVTAFNSRFTTKCRCYNTGSTSAGTLPAITCQNYSSKVLGCTIDSWRGYGILINAMSDVMFCIVSNTKATGVGAISCSETNAAYRSVILNCTIYQNAADGIKVSHAQAVAETLIFNNIIALNAAYGLNYSVGSTALNDRVAKGLADFNDFYTNTSGARNNISAGANDLALDPTFTNAAAGDFSIGTNLKALAFPGVFPGGLSTGALDMGACQRVEAGGGLPWTGLIARNIGTY